MTQEEKNLLLDLCARLPYNIIVEYGYKFEDIDKGEKRHILTGRMLDSYFYNITLGGTKVTSIKPYLRPMSSMTEEELYEWTHTWIMDSTAEKYDWLNAHHFDYRGLIEKGLALEAPEGMYNF